MDRRGWPNSKSDRIAIPSYGDDVGPKIRTLKYLKLSSAGSALIPGAV